MIHVSRDIAWASLLPRPLRSLHFIAPAFSNHADCSCFSESTSIPVNPRTGRPVGYAFVDLETAEGAEKAITDLSGKEILERKVSVQVARKPEAAGEGVTGTAPTEPTSGGEGRKRGSGRGRGRGRGRGGRAVGDKIPLRLRRC